MPTFRLTIEYDGAGFSGWQSQPGGIRTVQGVLEEALATVLRQPVPIQGASRTDAGVHALGQVASFESDIDLPLDRLQRSLTGLAGEDVSVTGCAIGEAGFNARFDARGKHYRYRVLARPAPAPLERHTSWHVRQPLDADRMRSAADRLEGTHDFAGFRAADCEREKTVRELSRVDVTEVGEGMVVIDVEGSGFLKNMVRIIVGTLVDVGRGQLPLERIDEVLSSGDRTRAGQTAPARGLTLVEVFY